MNNNYRNVSWRIRRQQIIEADGNACCDCGRKSSEATLQVHHLKYDKGKRIWEYDRENLITLCKGCHARRHKIITSIPQDGWTYEGCDDLGDFCGQCELCGAELRYEHCISHPDYGSLTVGCDCADRLTQTNTASEFDKKMHRNTERLKRFLKSPKWKQRKNCYFFPDLEGYKIMIAETDYGYYLTIFYSYYTDTDDSIKYGKIHSKQKYETLDAAKWKIYDAIISNKIRNYLIKKKNIKPLHYYVH